MKILIKPFIPDSITSGMPPTFEHIGMHPTDKASSNVTGRPSQIEGRHIASQ